MTQQECRRGSTDVVWFVRRHRDAGVLRLRRPEPMVHPGIRWHMPLGFGLWIPPGRLALRSCGGGLVSRRGAPLVAGDKLKLTREPESSFSGEPLSKPLRIGPAGAAHPQPNPRSGLTRNAG